MTTKSTRSHKRKSRTAPHLSTEFIPDDRQVRFAQASRLVEEITGEAPHPTIFYRWEKVGLFGVKLRTAYAGGVKRTTRAWIREFFAAVNEAKGLAPTERSARSKQVEDAKAKLANL